MSPDKRKVDGSAARAFGALAMLNDATKHPGPLMKVTEPLGVKASSGFSLALPFFYGERRPDMPERVY